MFYEMKHILYTFSLKNPLPNWSNLTHRWSPGSYLLLPSLIMNCRRDFVRKIFHEHVTTRLDVDEIFLLILNLEEMLLRDFSLQPLIFITLSVIINDMGPQFTLKSQSEYRNRLYYTYNFKFQFESESAEPISFIRVFRLL
jgi:hypothetical protein